VGHDGKILQAPRWQESGTSRERSDGLIQGSFPEGVPSGVPSLQSACKGNKERSVYDQTGTRSEHRCVWTCLRASLERANTLKKALESRKAFDNKERDKAIEALDGFLKAGKEFEQAVKRRAKTQAVEPAVKEIESALSNVEKTSHDQQAALDALDEIERAVKAMKKKIQDRKKGK